MSIHDTPFLDREEASELFYLMSQQTEKQRQRLAALELSPRELLERLRKAS